MTLFTGTLRIHLLVTFLTKPQILRSASFMGKDSRFQRIFACVTV